MRGNDAARRKRGVDLGKAPGDIFIGKAMKAVAPDTLVMQRARKRKARSDNRLVVVEGGVKAGDLRQFGT